MSSWCNKHQRKTNKIPFDGRDRKCGVRTWQYRYRLGGCAPGDGQVLELNFTRMFLQCFLIRRELRVRGQQWSVQLAGMHSSVWTRHIGFQWATTEGSAKNSLFYISFYVRARAGQDSAEVPPPYILVEAILKLELDLLDRESHGRLRNSTLRTPGQDDPVT